MTELRRRLQQGGRRLRGHQEHARVAGGERERAHGARSRARPGVVVAKDPSPLPKLLVDFAKENDQRPALKGGLLEGGAIDDAQVKKLASMPSRSRCSREFGAGLQAPMAAFVGALNGLLYMSLAPSMRASRSRKRGRGDPRRSA